MSTAPIDLKNDADETSVLKKAKPTTLADLSSNVREALKRAYENEPDFAYMDPYEAPLTFKPYIPVVFENDDELSCIRGAWTMLTFLMATEEYEAVLEILNYENVAFEFCIPSDIFIPSRGKRDILFLENRSAFDIAFEVIRPLLFPLKANTALIQTLFSIIQKLLEKHKKETLDPTQIEKHQKKLNEYALRANSIELLQLLQQYGASLSECTTETLNPHTSLDPRWWYHYNNPEVIHFLIAQKANIHQVVDNSGLNALHVAALRNKHIPTIKMMLHLGIPFDALDKSQNTPLMCLKLPDDFLNSIICFNEESRKTLIELFTNLEKLFNICATTTPSQTRDTKNNIETIEIESILKFLMTSGENGKYDLVNVRNREGLTALHVAIKHQANPAIIECLLKYGASTLASNEHNQCAIDLIPEGEKLDNHRLISDASKKELMTTWKNFFHRMRIILPPALRQFLISNQAFLSNILHYCLPQTKSHYLPDHRITKSIPIWLPGTRVKVALFKSSLTNLYNNIENEFNQALTSALPKIATALKREIEILRAHIRFKAQFEKGILISDPFLKSDPLLNVEALLDSSEQLDFAIEQDIGTQLAVRSRLDVEAQQDAGDSKRSAEINPLELAKSFITDISNHSPEIDVRGSLNHWIKTLNETIQDYKQLRLDINRLQKELQKNDVNKANEVNRAPLLLSQRPPCDSQSISLLSHAAKDSSSLTAAI